MLEIALNLLALRVIFTLVIWALQYVCRVYQLPVPILWVCGVVLLVALLVALSSILGVPGAPNWRILRVQ